MEEMTLDELQSQMDELNQKQENEKREFPTWRPVPDKKTGEATQIVKIVPYRLDTKKLAQSLSLHWNISKKGPFQCPKMFDLDCPLCNLTFPFWEAYEEVEDDVLKNIHRGLFAQERYITPVVLVGREDLGIKLWDFSPNVFEELLKIAKELLKRGDSIYNPKNCAEIEILVQTPKKAGTYYNNYEVKYVSDDKGYGPKITPLLDGGKEANALMESCQDISKIYPKLSLVEVAKYAVGKVNSAKHKVDSPDAINWDEMYEAIGWDLVEKVRSADLSEAKSKSQSAANNESEDEDNGGVDPDLPF